MKRFFLPAFLFFVHALQAQVGIGTNTPDGSAQLQIAATDKGLLIPQMTSSQRTGILSPATGLLVYQSDGVPGFYYNTGTPGAPSWINLATYTLQQNISTNGKYLSGDGTNTGFKLADNGLVLGEGAFGSAGTDLPSPGIGSKLIWYPKKAAFRAGYNNVVAWDNANIGNTSFAGGNQTIASAQSSTAFGEGTKASGQFSTALGNASIASGIFSFAEGYASNSSGYNSVCMGAYGTASGSSSVALGQSCTSSGNGSIAGGLDNIASNDAAIALGNSNTASGYAAISLGKSNNAGGSYSTAIGYNNLSYGDYGFSAGYQSKAQSLSTVAIGFQNTASGDYSQALGNIASSPGYASIAMGNNVIANGDFSTAMGRFAHTNSKTGSFAIGDASSGNYLYNDYDNQLSMRFAGGYKLYTSSNLSTGLVMFNGSNGWSVISDVNRKENFTVADGEDFLQKIAAFKLGSWNYKGQDPATFRHYGPMAQDIYNAFGKDHYGTIGNDTTINQADFDGINLIAIQALEKRTSDLQKENELQRRKIEQLENDYGDRIKKLEAALEKKNN